MSESETHPERVVPCGLGKLDLVLQAQCRWQCWLQLHYLAVSYVGSKGKNVYESKIK